MDKTQLAELAERFLSGTATEKEIALLHEWYDTADKEEIELVFTPEPETTEAVGKRMFSGVQQVIQEERDKTRHRRIVLARRWIAAASVIFVVVFAGKYFWDARGNTKPAPGVAQVTKPGNDLPPGSNKATLWLGDGSMIDLADAKNGTIRHEAGARIEKKDGQLIYGLSKGDGGSGSDGSRGADGSTRPDGSRGADGSKDANGSTRPDASKGANRSTRPAGSSGAEPSAMNTIQTPRGGQYEVILADGTKVWLNSASSLKYPTTFTGDRRQVQLKGEAYFEVAEDKNKPFKVSVGDVQVDVLGTHFDVMAYEDENAINTTLLAGAVRVTSKASASPLAGSPSPPAGSASPPAGSASQTPAGSTSRILAANQEASLDRSSGSFSVNQVDAEEAVAWKDGFFEFQGVSIETVMRQLARWYDVDVEYQGRTDKHFRGKISRSSNVSEVFKMLELTGEVHFSMDGKKIIVKP